MAFNSCLAAMRSSRRAVRAFGLQLSCMLRCSFMMVQVSLQSEWRFGFLLLFFGVRSQGLSQGVRKKSGHMHLLPVSSTGRDDVAEALQGCHESLVLRTDEAHPNLYYADCAA